MDAVSRQARVGQLIIVESTTYPGATEELLCARLADRGLSVGEDIFVAFSTANPGAASARPTADITALSNAQISPLFEATVQATEEAIINAMVAAETMVGRDGNRSEAIPHDRLREILRAYNRLNN